MAPGVTLRLSSAYEVDNNVCNRTPEAAVSVNGDDFFYEVTVVKSSARPEWRHTHIYHFLWSRNKHFVFIVSRSSVGDACAFSNLRGILYFPVTA